jgi:hypothetical protein
MGPPTFVLGSEVVGTPWQAADEDPNTSLPFHARENPSESEENATPPRFAGVHIYYCVGKSRYPRPRHIGIPCWV